MLTFRTPKDTRLFAIVPAAPGYLRTHHGPTRYTRFTRGLLKSGS